MELSKYCLDSIDSFLSKIYSLLNFELIRSANKFFLAFDLVSVLEILWFFFSGVLNSGSLISHLSMSSSEFMSAFWDSKFCASGIGECDAERILPSSDCFLALVLTLVKKLLHYSFVGVNQPEPISLTFLSYLASLFLFVFIL